jgi:hypothetical protein
MLGVVAMLADKLFDELEKLNHAEKLRVMQWLANKLVVE